MKLLTFLFIAAKKGYEVLSYSDHAVGEMAKGENGVPWVSVVMLHPKVTYRDDTIPDREAKQELHHHAHHQCFIANSVKTDIRVEF